MNKWIIHWYQNFAYFHNVCSFQRLFACKSHMCWLDAINLGCSYKTQIILIENGVNKHNTHTTTNTFFYHHKQCCYKLNTQQKQNKWSLYNYKTNYYHNTEPYAL